MAVTPNFPATPRTWAARATAANTARTSPANVVVLAQGAAGGSRINQIDIVSDNSAASAAQLVRIWVSLNGGSNWFLWREVAIPAGNAAGTTTNTASARINLDKSTTETPINLPDAQARLGITTHVADAVSVVAIGEDF